MTRDRVLQSLGRVKLAFLMKEAKSKGIKVVEKLLAKGDDATAMRHLTAMEGAGVGSVVKDTKAIEKARGVLNNPESSDKLRAYAQKKVDAFDAANKAARQGGAGSIAQREIKGMTDEVLGAGEYGVVTHAFHGGKAVPTKRIKHQFAPKKKGDTAYVEGDRLQQGVKDLEREAVDSVKIENVVKQDKDLRQIVQTPDFLAKNTAQTGLVGQGAATVNKEMTQLQSLVNTEIKQLQGVANPTSQQTVRLQKLQQGDFSQSAHLTKSQKSRVQQLNKLQGSTDLGRGQSMPMSRVDFNQGGRLTSQEQHLQQVRGYKARNILEDRHGMALTDLNPGRAENMNMAFSADGKPVLMDFGIVMPKGVLKPLKSGQQPKQLTSQVQQASTGSRKEYEDLVNWNNKARIEADQSTISQLTPTTVGLKNDNSLMYGVGAAAAGGLGVAALSGRGKKRTNRHRLLRPPPHGLNPAGNAVQHQATLAPPAPISSAKVAHILDIALYAMEQKSTSRESRDALR
jgi:hypothetical protein